MDRPAAPSPPPWSPDLRQRVAAGERLLAPILRMPDEAMVEACGLAGFDAVLVDCEHGPADAIPLGSHLRAAAAVGLPALVRVGDRSGPEVLRALDLGAAGIVAPRVHTVDDAQEVVRAVRYPPLGRRGLATPTRAGAYGMGDPGGHAARIDAGTFVVVQVESLDAVRAVDDLVAVEGVDGVFVGPADLGHDLASRDPRPDLDVPTARELVRDAAARSGRALVSIVSTPDEAAAELAAGTAIVVVNLASATARMLRGFTAGRA